MRSFSLTLNFISPKAYKYVRKVFDVALPHESTLNCIKSVDAPGFTAESFRAFADAAKNTNYQIFRSLQVDEMAILEHNGDHGYVDFNNDIMANCNDKARDALIFMVTPINQYWKPVGRLRISK